MSKKIIAYKGFNKDMTCRGFQYEEGKTYETENIKICDRGFHACEDPLDIFSYYDATNSIFHTVELSGKTERKENEDTKIVAQKITIGAEIDFAFMVKASIDFVFSKCKEKSGYCATNASAGDSATNASAGAYATNASAGNSAKNASAGAYAKNASAGDYAKNASAGDSAKNASAGDCAKNASAGDSAKNASAGDSANNEMNGKNSVSVDAGAGGMAKGKIGCWFALTEWKNGVPVCVKATKIDGKRIKEDAWYTLKNKKFVEVK